MTVRVERWVRLVVTGNDSKRGKGSGRWVRLVVTGNGSNRGKGRKMGKAGSHE